LRAVDAGSLRNRLAVATSIWREAVREPLPRIAPADPATQVQAFEIELVERLAANATPGSAGEVADRTWDLVHDRPDSDPVKRRVSELHGELARLSHGRD